MGIFICTTNKAKKLKMKETTLLRIALICSLVGLVALYFASTKIELKEYVPNQLNKNIGDDVKLKGTITKITDKGDVVFLEINQNNPITVVLFTDDNLKLKNNETIEVFGKVEEYKGKEEIIAQKIRVIR